MGARLLSAWVAQPLTQLAPLLQRQDAVAALVGDAWLRSSLRAAVQGIADLERLAGRVAQRACGPRDARALARALRRVPAVAELLRRDSTPDVIRAASGGPLDQAADVADDIE